MYNSNRNIKIRNGDADQSIGESDFNNTYRYGSLKFNENDITDLTANLDRSEMKIIVERNTIFEQS